MRRILLVLSETAREKVKESSQRFKESKPGHRFRDRYHHCQQGSSAKFNPRAIFSIVGGILVVVGGVIAVPGPGPGWLIIFLGLGMVAGESLLVARFLDWVEVKVRSLARRAKGIWTSSPAVAKILISLTILLCVAALGYRAYYYLASIF